MKCSGLGGSTGGNINGSLSGFYSRSPNGCYNLSCKSAGATPYGYCWSRSRTGRRHSYYLRSSPYSQSRGSSLFAKTGCMNQTSFKSLRRRRNWKTFYMKTRRNQPKPYGRRFARTSVGASSARSYTHISLGWKFHIRRASALSWSASQ